MIFFLNDNHSHFDNHSHLENFIFFFFFTPSATPLVRLMITLAPTVPSLLKLKSFCKLVGVGKNKCLSLPSEARGWVRAKRADLSTGYPQALRRSLRPRAKRARPLYYSPHNKKECLRRPLRGSYGYLNAIFCSQTLSKAF